MYRNFLDFLVALMVEILSVAPTKSKRKATILPIPRVNSRASVVDEFGMLRAQIVTMKPLIERCELLRQQITEWYADQDPERTFQEDGSHWSIAVGPKGLRRTVYDMAALQAKLGIERFLKVCSVSMEQLDEFVAPADQKTFIQSDRSGPRTIRAIAKYSETAA